MDQKDRALTALRPARGLRAVPTDVTEMGTAAATRIVVLDDHTLYREGLREILRAEGGFVVVGEAADYTGAVRAVAETQPDVALLDARLCGPADDDVADTVRAILAASPDTRVIAMSLPDSPYTIQALLAAGVRGYLLESAT